MDDSSRDRLPFEPTKKAKKKPTDRPRSQSSKLTSQPKSVTTSAEQSSRKPTKLNENSHSTPSSTPAGRTSSQSPAGANRTRRPGPSPIPPPRSSRASQNFEIPEAVNRRMLARMGLFSGTPTIFGILSLVGSYFVITKEWFPLPNVAVLLVSMGFFGLGVLGLSYGALSASWDEENEGSAIGITEFKTNLGRLTAAWRSAKRAQK